MVDVLLIVVFIAMLVGSVWGWRKGYAAFDVTTVVWLVVMVVVLLMIIAPGPMHVPYR